MLSVSGRLGGRDWQGKVYGDIVANTVEVVSEGAKDSAASDDEGLPRVPRRITKPMRPLLQLRNAAHLAVRRRYNLARLLRDFQIP